MVGTPQELTAATDCGIADVEALAATSVDDLVDALDVSLDEAESILESARAIVAAKNDDEADDVESAMIEDAAAETAEADAAPGAEAEAQPEAEESAVEEAAGTDVPAEDAADSPAETNEDNA